MEGIPGSRSVELLENGTPLSERLFYFFDIQPRVSNDTRNRDALAIVAAFVRFNALKILFTPALDFAIVFQRANVFV
jgi:hypothetical protein